MTYGSKVFKHFHLACMEMISNSPIFLRLCNGMFDTFVIKFLCFSFPFAIREGNIVHVELPMPKIKLNLKMLILSSLRAQKE